jgi:hypothetical protein
MSFGRPGTGRDWALDGDDAEPIFRQAVELGITSRDTADVYSGGNSEEIVGEAIGSTRAARTWSWLQTLRADGPRLRRPRAVAPSRLQAGGRVAAATGHRLHRPLTPDPPLFLDR